MYPKYALEAQAMYNAILGAMELQTEIDRLRNKIFAFDVRRFYQPAIIANLKLCQRVVEDLARPMISEKDLGKAIDRLQEHVVNFDLLCDAFYAHKPFFADLFKQFVIYSHSVFEERIKTLWSQNFKELTAKQILDIAATAMKWGSVMASWQISDSNYRYCERPLIESFFARLYDNNLGTLFNIITSITTNYTPVDGIATSPGMASLENHLLFIVDHYTKVPVVYCLEEGLRYAGRVLHATMLILYKMLAEKTAIDVKVLISIYNTSFIKLAKTVIKKAHEIGKGVVDLPRTKLYMNERFISYLNIKICDITWTRFKKCVAERIRQSFGTVKDLLQLNMTFVMREILSYIESLLRLFAIPNHVPEFYNYVFTKILKSYIVLFVASQPNMTQAHLQKYYAKVVVDQSDFEKLCVESIVADSEIVNNRFESFVEFLNSQDLDLILIRLLNLDLFVKKCKDPSFLRQLIRSKVYLPKDCEEFIVEHFAEVGRKPNVAQPVLTKSHLQKKRNKMFIHTGLILFFYFKMSALIRTLNEPDAEDQRADRLANATGENDRTKRPSARESGGLGAQQDTPGVPAQIRSERA